MARTHVVEHPLVQHFLTQLRDDRTGPVEFREHIRRLAVLLACEATRDLPLTAAAVNTPLAPVEGRKLSQRVGLVPILRSGLGMVDAVLDLLPQAEVWHLGFYRDERTLQPVEYYKKLPAKHPVDVALVLDPMLATGGSAIAALDALREWGVPHVKLLAMIAAPEGIAHVHQHSPETEIVVGAIDSHLNDRGYIVPGLGDAGDRMFNAVAN